MWGAPHPHQIIYTIIIISAISVVCNANTGSSPSGHTTNQSHCRNTHLNNRWSPRGRFTVNIIRAQNAFQQETPILTQRGITHPLAASEVDTHFVFVNGIALKAWTYTHCLLFSLSFHLFMASTTEFLIPLQNSGSGFIEKSPERNKSHEDESARPLTWYVFHTSPCFIVATLRAESCHLIFHKKGSQCFSPELSNHLKGLPINVLGGLLIYF